MNKSFLPQTNNNLMYTPLGIKGLFAAAVKEEGKNIEKVLADKRKYRQLIEMWQASYLAVALYKATGKKFSIVPDDRPDLYFIERTKNGQEGFPVEVMELYKYQQDDFDGNYESLANKVWKKKGINNYGKCELLLVARMSSKQFNVAKLAELINKCKWTYIRIWLSIYNRSNAEWSIFEIYPVVNVSKIKYLKVGIGELPY